MLKKITIATRKSPLALWQAEHVASLLKSKNHGIEITFKKIVTDGDKIIDKPLYEVGGKGLFLKQLEEALLSKEADIAVHSMNLEIKLAHQVIEGSVYLMIFVKI